MSPVIPTVCRCVRLFLGRFGRSENRRWKKN
nr:MAG TPA: hypothetical protein [Caudoviricetes sp.]DAR90230.1 MAG TPA: hypothetical protein [Caudoviricetes sp.]